MVHAEYVMDGSSCSECISVACRIDGWLEARRKNVGEVGTHPFRNNLFVLGSESVYMNNYVQKQEFKAISL